MPKITYVKKDVLGTYVGSLGVGSEYTTAVFGLDGFVNARAIFSPASGNATIGFDQSVNSVAWDVTSSVVVSAGLKFCMNNDIYGRVGRYNITGVTSATDIRFVAVGIPVT